MSLPVSSLWSGERRMEAENYLSTGYGRWLALEARLGAEARLGGVARVWQPSRLKGITVSKDFGVPFLAATQVFDVQPIARKFLSLDRTEDSADRFTALGSILVTYSGTVGRATLATEALSQTLISHDLLRVQPHQQSDWGWIYAFLRSNTARSMMTAAKYGHIIKHLEPSHLSKLPMPTPRSRHVEAFATKAQSVLDARNKAVRKMAEANEIFEREVGIPKVIDIGESGFPVRASALMSGRRRVEATFHNPMIKTIRDHFAKRKLRAATISEIGFDVWLPTRFRRIPAEEGVKLVGSADLFEINPDLNKRIADIDFGDRSQGRVKRGWLLLARSGQTYGLNGTLAIANAFHEEKIISDHVIRIAAKDDCTARSGYIYTALSHPILGRPLVKALAYGSSIPEIEVADVSEFDVVRLKSEVEARIADCAEEGARLFASADILENEMAAEVDDMIDGLLGGDWSDFVRFSAS
jgi:hypothetical protein